MARDVGAQQARGEDCLVGRSLVVITAPPLPVGALAANITCDAPLFPDIAPPSPLSRVGLPTLIVRRTTAHLSAKL